MADEVDRVVGELERFAERLIVKLTLDVAANLIEATPVDTGWARANWVAAIGAPAEADVDLARTDEQAAAGRAAEQQASLGRVAADYDLAGGAVFVTNNVAYISRLNEGSSRQAPAGFVQQAIGKAVTQDILGIGT